MSERTMEPERLREVEFPEVDQGLKDDVRRLGALVGEMLAEQHGAGFLAEIERLRTGNAFSFIINKGKLFWRF